MVASVEPTGEQERLLKSDHNASLASTWLQATRLVCLPVSKFFGFTPVVYAFVTVATYSPTLEHSSLTGLTARALIKWCKCVEIPVSSPRHNMQEWTGKRRRLPSLTLSFIFPVKSRQVPSGLKAEDLLFPCIPYLAKQGTSKLEKEPTCNMLSNHCVSL